MDIIFLNPLDSQSNTQQQALDEVISIIRNTRGLLRIAIAYFTHPMIANELIQREQRGRETNLLLNTSDLLRPVNPNESEIVISKYLMQVLRRVGGRSLGFRTKTTYQNMHHKFAVSSEWVIFGSLNWTLSALKYNFESIAITDESDVVEKFIREFDKLWVNAQDLNTSDGKIRMIICPICESMDGVDFESWGPFCLFCGHKFKMI